MIHANRDEIKRQEPDQLLRRKPTGWIPEAAWGIELFLARTKGGRLGMDRLSRIVSQVQPCTRRDIMKIESATALPTDQRLRRIALCGAAALGLDPVYMEHQLGLTPQGCDVELAHLRAINPAWVELVKTMDELLAARPAKWIVEGER